MMKKYQIDFVEYTEDFLELSWMWLNDPEIKTLTMTPDFSKEDQLDFFRKIPLRANYKISGILVNGEKSGACGLKNIENGEAELWCYLGEKKYWGAGIGCYIIQHIESECKRLGVQRLYLKVAKSNLRALSSYKKNGFNVDCERLEYIIMAKCLLAF